MNGSAGVNIRNKAQFFELWKAGVLGNRTNLWDSVYEAIEDRATSFGFRQIGKTGGGAWTRVNTPAEAIEVSNEWRSLGRKFIVDDGCPDDKRILQGEICRTYKGMEGFLDTTSKLPMRQAIAAGHMKHCSYGTCIGLLNRYMDPSSRDDLDQLLELYPDAAIEFSCFSVNVGVFPNRKTIFWEVRNY